MQIILDVSANTMKNDVSYYEKMVRAVGEIDPGENEIIFKTQLFRNLPPNMELSFDVFDKMYDMTRYYEYTLTSSVFNTKMLKFLSVYEVPFIKIACRKELYSLAYMCHQTPYVSIESEEDYNIVSSNKIQKLFCVPKYPAKYEDYRDNYDLIIRTGGLSDHSEGLHVFRWAKHFIDVYECHYILDEDPGNPDAGPFAKRLEEIKEIINA